MPDRGHATYCLAHPAFYEAPEVSRGDDVDFDVSSSPLPPGWRTSELDDWLVCAPVRVTRPKQGWKIHVSATLDSAEGVLEVVRRYCFSHAVPFKYIRSKQLLLMRNGKYADRAASGKLIAIYPADEDELRTVLEGLDARLSGEPGPYILSDLRWSEGPLYVRYGGFAERFCLGPDGKQVLAIEDPSGDLVPDRREPVFSPPEWVTLPPFLEPHHAARFAATVDEIPYRIEKALHFSNGGGIYQAVHLPTGAKVVLKEGRPHAGLDLAGVDAVTRLRREAEILRKLEDLEVAPRVVDEFDLGDHHFVALAFVEGDPLRVLVADRLPLVQEDPGPGELREYAAWVLDMVGKVEAVVASVHSRGVVIKDLHPSNLIVQPDGTVVLIDLEVASTADDPGRQSLADPHFLAPAGISGAAIDAYALACLRIFLFLPLTALVALSPGHAAELANVVRRSFPVPDDFLDEAVTTIEAAWGAGDRHPDAPTEPPVRLGADAPEDALRSMAAAILVSAEPSREDRLFPGDPRGFDDGGLGLAYGASGVLLALAGAGERRTSLEEWLVRRSTSPEPGVHLGLYDGLHGAAYALDRLGRREDALKVVDLCRHEIGDSYDRFGLDLFSGLAGIGLGLLHFASATNDALLLDEAVRVGRLVAGRLGGPDDVAETSGGRQPYAGLVRGSSGPALLFLHLHELTADPTYLDLAATALQQDLRRCVVRDEDGSLEVNEGWRTMPYLADGSIGIGLVLDRYLGHREDERFRQALHRIDRAARGQLYVEPGLFYGRAGMILYLAARRESGDPRADESLRAHVDRLNWHALGWRGHLAFPGEELMRLSMDLASGTAGVLVALGAAFTGAPGLPFLIQAERR
ncbi:MAG TPA: class III lanthionine synthetase LanKC [Nocardioidaceae bacterium]|nr:class III lanthionine synthetase LanKC [Nocardioidaceae bacterium]